MSKQNDQFCPENWISNICPSHKIYAFHISVVYELQFQSYIYKCGNPSTVKAISPASYFIPLCLYPMLLPATQQNWCPVPIVTGSQVLHLLVPSHHEITLNIRKSSNLESNVFAVREVHRNSLRFKIYSIFPITQLKTYCILDTQRILHIQTFPGCLFKL